MLTTPPTASAPKAAEAPLASTSTRSMKDIGSVLRSTEASAPRPLFGRRRPLSNTTVGRSCKETRTDPSPAVADGRAVSAAPGALTLVLSGEPVVIGSACRTSPIELWPPRSMSRRSSTVTGATAWVGSSHQREPVTITSSSGSSGEGGLDGLSAASAAAPKGGPAQPDGKAQLDPAKILTVRSFRNSKRSPVPASRRWSASAAGRPRGAPFETWVAAISET